MQKIIAEVYATDPDYDDRPYTFTMKVSSELVREVTELSKLVRDSNAYAMTTFFNAGMWSAAYMDDIMGSVPVADQDLDNEVQGYLNDDYYVDQYLTQLEAEPQRIESMLLEVQGNKFKFTCYPKHGDGRMELSTATIDIEELYGVNNIIVGDW